MAMRPPLLVLVLVLALSCCHIHADAESVQSLNEDLPGKAGESLDDVPDVDEAKFISAMDALDLIASMDSIEKLSTTKDQSSVDVDEFFGLHRKHDHEETHDLGEGVSRECQCAICALANRFARCQGCD